MCLFSKWVTSHQIFSSITEDYLVIISFFSHVSDTELVTAQTHQTDCCVASHHLCLAQKAALEHTVKDYSRRITSLCVTRLRERKQLALPRGGSSLWSSWKRVNRKDSGLKIYKLLLCSSCVFCPRDKRKVGTVLTRWYSGLYSNSLKGI